MAFSQQPVAETTKASEQEKWLDIQITGGELNVNVAPSTEDDRCGLLVHSIEIIENTNMDVKVKKQDRIMQINGHDLSCISFTQAKNIFRTEIKRDKVWLKVIRLVPKEPIAERNMDTRLRNKDENASIISPQKSRHSTEVNLRERFPRPRRSFSNPDIGKINSAYAKEFLPKPCTTETITPSILQNLAEHRGRHSSPGQRAETTDSDSGVSDSDYISTSPDRNFSKRTSEQTEESYPKIVKPKVTSNIRPKSVGRYGNFQPCKDVDEKKETVSKPIGRCTPKEQFENSDSNISVAEAGIIQVPTTQQAELDDTSLEPQALDLGVIEKSMANTLHEMALGTESEHFGDDDDDLWNRCLKTRIINYGKTALKQNILPDQQMLNRLVNVFGRKECFVTDICRQICRHIADKDESIFDVWPAFQPNSKDKEIEIVFVIVLKEIKNDNIKERTKLKQTIEYSYVTKFLKDKRKRSEGESVIYHKEFRSFFSQLSSSDRARLKQSMNRNNAALMKKHNYLMMISGSPVRSKDYGTTSHTIVKELCLVLYVFVKGFIPIQEDPFDKEYDSIPIDVREGFFELYTGHSFNKHDNLKVGCQIIAKDMQTVGTLGGFLDYNGYGTCGLTCAHVLLSPDEMKTLSRKENDMDTDDCPIGKTVYQPDNSEGNDIGKIVKLIYRGGGPDESGIDIAVFQISKRYPILGDFPRLKDGSFVNFSFDSGKTADYSKTPSEKFFKFGTETDLTYGSLVTGDLTSSVRTYGKDEVNNENGIILHHVVEIKNKDTQFANFGDSGALVFIGEGDNTELYCVGIVEGGTANSTCIMMPILPILEQLNLTSFKCFESNRLKTEISTLKTQVLLTEHNMKAEFQQAVAELKTELKTWFERPHPVQNNI